MRQRHAQPFLEFQNRAAWLRLRAIGCARGGMADAPDLGSGSERSGGSSPLARTTPPLGDVSTSIGLNRWRARALVAHRLCKGKWRMENRRILNWQNWSFAKRGAALGALTGILLTWIPALLLFVWGNLFTA